MVFIVGWNHQKYQPQRGANFMNFAQARSRREPQMALQFLVGVFFRWNQQLQMGNAWKTSQPNKHVLQDPGFSKIWQVQQMHHPETTGSPSPSSFLTKKASTIYTYEKTPTRMPSSTSWSILEPSWVSLRRKNSRSSWNFWSAASLWRKIRANDSGGDFWVRGNEWFVDLKM